MQSIVIFVILSFVLGVILTNFIKLSDSKKGEDFTIREYVSNFSIKKIDLKYVIILFILFLLLIKDLQYTSIFVFSLVIFSLVLALIMDIKYMIIPDTCSILILFSGICNLISCYSKEKLIASVIGLLVGGLTLFIIDFIFEKITKQEGFGYGDMKLLASLGLLLGYKDVVVIMILSVVISAIFSIVYLIVNKIKNIKGVYIAFGPFIVISTFIVMIIPSSQIVNWYVYIMDTLVNKMI